MLAWLLTWLMAVCSGMIASFILGRVDVFCIPLIAWPGVLALAAMPFGESIEPAETLRWSWGAARRSLSYLKLGLAVWGGGALGIALFGALRIWWVRDYPIRQEALFLARELGTWLGSGIGGLGLFVLGSGLVKGEMTSKGEANEGIRRSARSALTSVLGIGLGSWLVFVLIVGLNISLDAFLGDLLHLVLPWVEGGWGSWVTGGLVIGIGVGLVVGLRNGGTACFRHLLLRYRLLRDDLAPWQYVTFLDYATERIFLRKVGGGYIFIHRLLQDYFAELWEQEYAEAEVGDGESLAH
jgi:hypothetical protein